MKLEKTDIADVVVLHPQAYEDERGIFYEAYNSASLRDAGVLFSPVQENCAFSVKKGTIRGLHFQNEPFAQAKLVRCTQGKVIDYAIDLRKGSPTYLKWVSVALSAENKNQLFIPKGFAHGVISVVDNSMIEYFADNPYTPTHDRSIRYNDPEIGIEWGCSDPILSPKDRNAPFVSDSDCNFIWSPNYD